jgi:hypothetical protein
VVIGSFDFIQVRCINYIAMFETNGLFYWRCAIQQVTGVLNEEIWSREDENWFVSVALAGCRFARVPAVLAAFRIHATSISSQNRWQEKRTRDHERIAARIRAGGYRRHEFKAVIYRLAVRLVRSIRHLFPKL